MKIDRFNHYNYGNQHNEKNEKPNLKEDQEESSVKDHTEESIFDLDLEVNLEPASEVIEGPIRHTRSCVCTRTCNATCDVRRCC